MNTIDTTTRVDAPAKRPLLGNSPLLARLAKASAISALAIMAACSDSDGVRTLGNQSDASIATDSGVTGTDTTDASADADAGSTDSAAVDAGTAVDTSTADVSAGTDTESTVDAAADTQSQADVASTVDAKPSTPDINSVPPKATKSAPADEAMSGYVDGMELPIEQVIVSNKPYTAVVGFGHKNGVKPLLNDFVGSVNGADVYTIKAVDFPQDDSVAGTQNFRVVTTNNPSGAKIGSYVSTLTGEKAQDGVTPLYDQGAILPVLCDDGEYNPEDATLLTEAMTMTGKMEFNHNLEEMRDTYLANLQKNINAVFGAAGKTYAPQCEIQLVTPGTPGVVDGQVCPVGCLVSYVTVQPIAKWTEQIQK